MKLIEAAWQVWLGSYSQPHPTGRDLREMRWTFFAGVLALKGLVEAHDMSDEECEAVEAECNEVLEEMRAYDKGVN